MSERIKNANYHILDYYTNNLGNMKNFTLQHLVRCDSPTIFIFHLKNKIAKQQAYLLYK